MVTIERLKELYSYDAETGVFTRKKTGLFTKGVLLKDGYRNLYIDGKRYMTHRLAWLITYGTWPIDKIDHINGIKDDNRLSNLRDVSQRVNLQNGKKHRNGHLLGTTFHKFKQKWIARIIVNGKIQHIGTFDSAEDAHAAYIQAQPIKILLSLISFLSMCYF
jgi:hypothetical protein